MPHSHKEKYTLTVLKHRLTDILSPMHPTQNRHDRNVTHHTPKIWPDGRKQRKMCKNTKQFT